jgi:hypothetical protein
MARDIVFTPQAAAPPATCSQAVRGGGTRLRLGNGSGRPGHDPPARQCAKLPARIPGLKVSIAAIAEA